MIRCPKGNAAQMVAEGLDKKIRDNLRDPRNSMFSGDSMPMAQIRFVTSGDLRNTEYCVNYHG